MHRFKFVALHLKAGVVSTWEKNLKCDIIQQTNKTNIIVYMYAVNLHDVITVQLYYVSLHIK